MGFAVGKWYWSRFFLKHFVSHMLVFIPPVLHTFLQSKCATARLCEVARTVLLLLHHKFCGRSFNDGVSRAVFSGM
jgi:hypothetical protein